MSSGPWPPRASGEEDDEARRPLPAASARALSRVGARYSSAPVARRRADAARGRSGGDSGDAPDGDAPEPADRKAAAVRGGAARRRPMPRRAARVVGGAIWIPTTLTKLMIDDSKIQGKRKRMTHLRGLTLLSQKMKIILPKSK